MTACHPMVRGCALHLLTTVLDVDSAIADESQYTSFESFQASANIFLSAEVAYKDCPRFKDLASSLVNAAHAGKPLFR